MKTLRFILLTAAAVITLSPGPLFAADPITLTLRPTAQTDGQGVNLGQIVEGIPGAIEARLADAPAFGRISTLNRQQISEALQKSVPELGAVQWTGAETVRITRKARMLGDEEVRKLLTDRLQEDHVRKAGELELRLNRAWTPVSIPDEPLTVKVLDLPSSGLNANCLVRFELRTERELVGSWQALVQARIWREVPVAQKNLRRGQLLTDAEITTERRDLGTLRDPLLELPANPSLYEMAESVTAGSTLISRSIKLRPVVRRGQSAEAVLHNGAMTVSLKVEVLEDGVPGQTVRIRNPQTRRELHGRVQDENTILIAL